MTPQMVHEIEYLPNNLMVVKVDGVRSRLAPVGKWDPGRGKNDWKSETFNPHAKYRYQPFSVEGFPADRIDGCRIEVSGTTPIQRVNQGILIDRTLSRGLFFVQAKEGSGVNLFGPGEKIISAAGDLICWVNIGTKPGLAVEIEQPGFVEGETFTNLPFEVSNIVPHAFLQTILTVLSGRS